LIERPNYSEECYYLDGNITTITDAVNSNQVQTFGYDDLHRLPPSPQQGEGFFRG
jgi:YD repeat-containing protein